MKNRRKRFILEGNFQTRFILYFVLTIIGASFVSISAILLILYFKCRSSDATFGNFLAMLNCGDTGGMPNVLRIIIIPVLAAHLVILAITIPFSYFYSHRIIGPIFRIEYSLDLLLSGEMDFMIHLRKKDEFPFLAGKMNELIDYLRRNIEEVRSSYRLIRESVTKIAQYTTAEKIDVQALRKELTHLDRFFKERKTPFEY